MRPRWVVLVFALVFILGTALFFGRWRPNGAPYVRIGADGRYYWAYLTSLWLDRDLDFTNQYDNPRSGNYYGLQRTKTGHYHNPATIGPAILWSPTFLVGLAVSRLVESPQESGDGNSDLTQLITLYSTWLMAFLAMLLVYDSARKYFGPGPALAGAIAALWGGPVIHYAVNQPSYSHAQSALAVVAFLWAWDRWRGRRTLRGWVLLGVLLGAAMLMRTQNLAFVLPVVFEAVAGFVAAARQGGWRAAARACVGPFLAGAVALLTFFPQMIVWKVIYGTWAGVPQGADYIRWAHSSWMEALFASRNGLFPWAPAWWFGILGVIFLVWRRDRTLAIGLLAGFALTAYMNGAFWHWWGMGSFGGRRFDGGMFAAGIGFAALVGWAVDWAVRRPRLAAGVVAGAFTVGNATCVTLMAHDFQAHIGNQPDSTDMLAQYDRTAMTAGRALWSLGNPFSWPAPWWFALRTGAPPSRYDSAVGPMLLDGYKFDRPTDPSMHADVWLGDARNDRYLVRFPPARGKGADAVRPLRAPGGRVLVPLLIISEATIRCEGTGVAAGTLVARWNGDERARTAIAPGQPLAIAFTVPAGEVERDINLLDLDVEGVPDRTEAATLKRCGVDARR